MMSRGPPSLFGYVLDGSHATGGGFEAASDRNGSVIAGVDENRLFAGRQPIQIRTSAGLLECLSDSDFAVQIHGRRLIAKTL